MIENKKTVAAVVVTFNRLELLKKCIKCSRRRVGRLMKLNGMESCLPVRRTQTGFLNPLVISIPLYLPLYRLNSDLAAFIIS